MFALALAGGFAGATHALPMGSVGTWMVMGDYAADSRELAANHAITRSDALGAAVGRFRSDLHHSGHVTREYAGLTYTRLVHRWNLPHAQANLWFVGLAGSLKPGHGAGARAMVSPAVLADYETTRVYLGAGARALRASSVRQDSGWLRAGFSFHEVEYDEVQPWLVAEVKRTRDGLSKNEAAAWLRLIHKRYFVEIGADDDGRARFNFMWNH